MLSCDGHDHETLVFKALSTRRQHELTGRWCQLCPEGGRRPRGTRFTFELIGVSLDVKRTLPVFSAKRDHGGDKLGFFALDLECERYLKYRGGCPRLSRSLYDEALNEFLRLFS